MRRGIYLVIAEGKAKNLLNVEPEHVKIPAQYISELIENKESLITTEPTRFGDVQEKLLTNRSYVVPQLRVYSNNSINYDSLGVIKEPSSKLIGMLTDGEAKGLHLIIGKNLKGSISTEVEGDIATFDVQHGKSKFKLVNKDKNQLAFHIDIEVTAELMEYFGTVDFYQAENLKKFEKVLEREVEKLAENTLTKLKDDFQTDVLRLDNYLRVYHNKLWEEIKNDWDTGKNYFSKSEVTFDVTANITEPGTSVRTNEMGD